MRSLTLITGMGGVGKTTYAKSLKGVDVYYCDDVYYLVQSKLCILKEDLIKYPTEEAWEKEYWGGSPEELVKSCYMEMFNNNLPDKLVLEGQGIFLNRRENALIMKMFEGYKKEYIFIYPYYERWLKNIEERKKQENQIIPFLLSKEDYIAWNENFLKCYLPKETKIIRHKI